MVNDKVSDGGCKVNIRDDLWPKYNPESTIFRAPHNIVFGPLGEQGHIRLAIFLTLCSMAMLTCSWTVKLTKHLLGLKGAGACQG